MTKRARSRSIPHGRLDHDPSRDKVNEGELTDRILKGLHLLEVRNQYDNKGWREYIWKLWGLGPSNANEYMRVAARFGRDPIKMQRIVTSDLPFAIVKKLSYGYITDEMLERFYERIEPISARTAATCQRILNEVKSEYGITSQMSWIDADSGNEYSSELPSGVSENPIAGDLETLIPATPALEEISLHQYYSDLYKAHLNVANTYLTFANHYAALEQLPPI